MWSWNFFCHSTGCVAATVANGFRERFSVGGLLVATTWDQRLSSGVIAHTGAHRETRAIIELAEKDINRRKRFVEAIRGGGTLLFSVTNAAELSGQQGRSALLVSSFLHEIGLNWFLARLDATEVVRMEAGYADPMEACADRKFFLSYTADQMRRQALAATGIVPVSESLFRLGAIVIRWRIRQTAISTDRAAIIHGSILAQFRTAPRSDKYCLLPGIVTTCYNKPMKMSLKVPASPDKGKACPGRLPLQPCLFALRHEGPDRQA